MDEVEWETQHSVETAATPAFAWTYMTDVKNWNDPPAQFRLDGPFAAGTHGLTEIPEQPPRHWQLQEVKPTESYTIGFSLDGASMSSQWLFEELPDGRTLLTQHIVLKGENASAYVADIRQGFEPNLAPGMKKIATAIDQAYAASLRPEG
jgi:Polyketide cyclase / dehydrase and lipid transport